MPTPWNKLKISEEEFTDLYIDQNYSIKEICEHYSISEASVYRLIKKFGCHKEKTKVKHEYKPNKSIIYEELYEYYIIQNNSARKTAKRFDISERALYYWLQYYNIKKSKELIYKQIKNAWKNKTPSEMQKINTKRINYCQEHYNCDNIQQVPEIKQKAKNTYNNKSIEEKTAIIKKRQNTLYTKTGSIASLGTSKAKQKASDTYYKKTGYRHNMHNPEVKKKMSDTYFEKTGYRNPAQNPEVKAKTKIINLENYGVEYLLQNKEIRNKAKQTYYKKTGYENPSQNPEVQKKKEETCLKTLGVNYPAQSENVIQKIHKTMKENGTYGKSKDEDVIYELLIEKGYTVDRQHYNREKYPWCCDFYIIELDTYVEYQGFMSHGKDGTKIYGPYNSNNPEHRLLLEKWNKKSLEHSLYESAIRTWTVVDPLKRETAKKNNLNWLEFFTMEEFMLWYNNLPENK